MTRRMRAAVAVAGLVCAALALPLAGAAGAGGADGCVGYLGPNDLGVTGVIVTVGTGSGDTANNGPTVYVDLRDLGSDDWLFSIWLYIESNGEDGLQRGGVNLIGDTIPVLSGTETCNESLNHDTNVF